MRIVPRSRRVQVGAGVLIVALLGIVWIRRDDVRMLKDRVLPDQTYSDAADRTSPPARVEGDLPLPATADAPNPTGSDPVLAMGARIPLPAASALVDPPGLGPVLVSTLDGRVHSVDLVDGATTVVLDISDEISTGGERGLLGLALSPDAERIYLHHTTPNGDTQVRSWAFDGADAPIRGTGVVHLDVGQPYENHNGGHLVFGPDGALWIGTGDGGSGGDPGDVAQDDGSLLGKMLRVVPDPAGGVVAPSTNPDWDRPEIWGIGLRNPWRYSFDRETHRLWIADVGQDTTEEVSVIDGDAERPDFGWNTVEGDADYDGEPDPSFTAPVITYVREEGCSITGGYVYRGEANPSVYGWYLFSDYCTGFLRGVPANDPETTPVELATGLGNVISFGELDDGELVVLTTEGIQPIVTG